MTSVSLPAIQKSSKNGAAALLEKHELEVITALLNALKLGGPTKKITTKLQKDGKEEQMLCAAAKNKKSIEDLALENFSVTYRDVRDFSCGQHAHLLSELFTLLVTTRFIRKWIFTASWRTLFLRVLCLRLMMRDHTYLHHFVELKGIQKLEYIFERAVKCSLLETTEHFYIELLKETACVCQKIASLKEKRFSLIHHKIHQHLVLLLKTRHVELLHLLLKSLITLTTDVNIAAQVAKVNITDLLLTILQGYDVASKRLASQLLRVVSSHLQVRDDIKLYDGLPVLLSLLHGDSVELVWNICWTLVSLVPDAEFSTDVRINGGIPLLLTLLQNEFSNDKSALPSLGESHGLQSTYTEKANRKRAYVYSLRAGCCVLLTELVLNDANSQEVVHHNGIYIIAQLLLPEIPMQAQEKHWENLQKNAFRALRFLFSMERNRQRFKRLFPPDTFALFIDVGHYVKDLVAYQPLVDKVNSCAMEEVESLASRIKTSNENKAPIYSIGKYDVYELLGSGAFGSVYKVKKQGAKEKLLALKQLNVHYSGEKMSEKERGDLLNEMGIIRQNLNHPNVVRYYKVYQEKDRLCIVMELIEGAPLAEHFSSLREKHLTFSEERIWNIFIQMILALRYLHKEKGIVHRDLTPNNIMLGSNDKVTITDFGLAKQAQTSQQMTSVVGTILYSAPELVQNLPYGEKIDIWAAGAVLYEMCTLKHAFYSSNMLSLATKIVSGVYEPLPEGQYSKVVVDTVKHCLTVKSEDRPDILQVAALLGDQLMSYADNLQNSCNTLERKVEHEREKTKRHLLEANRIMQNFRMLVNASRLQTQSSCAAGSSTQLSSNKIHDSKGDASAESPGLGDSGVFMSERFFKQMSQDTTAAEESSSGEKVFRPSRGISKSAHVPRHTDVDIPKQLRPKSASMAATPTLSISARKMRQISDPAQEILNLIHKIMFITQLPPSLKHNPRRHLVECYQKKVFSSKAGCIDLKAELNKVILGGESLVDFGISEPHFLFKKASSMTDVDSGSEHEVGVTYCHLQSVIESVLVENGYYDVQFMKKSSSLSGICQLTALQQKT